MFFLCNDLMEKIGKEVEIIRYSKNLKDHKNIFIDVLNEFSDLIDDVEAELIHIYWLEYFRGTNHIYADIKAEFIHEVLDQDDVVMNVIKDTIPCSISSIVLKKI